MIAILVTVLLLLLLISLVVYRVYSSDVTNEEPLLTNLLSFQKGNTEGKEYSLI